MMQVAPTVSAILGVPRPRHAKGTPVREIVADLAGMHGVAVLALDAFGMFAWKLWQHEMPFLRTLHAQHSVALRAVMPSITPVNFATMVTGTDLPGHGVAAFTDDFACETLFDVIRAAKWKSAGVGLHGYTGCELLGRCADICADAGEGSDDAVVETILDCVDCHHPEFLIAQLGKIDDVFHQYGPSSPAMLPMLRDTDARLQRLVAHLTRLEYGIMILSDHGQHDVPNPSANGLMGMHGTDSPEDCLVPCTWTI